MLLMNNAASDFANVKGTTALMRASQEGHVEIGKSLIECNVDVNRKNNEGMNALMLASQRGHADIVYILVKAGAAMDEQTSQGSTALMLACKRGHEKCAEVLVTMGAEIFMKDRRNRTAKDTATRRNHLGLLCWLDTQVQVRRVQESRHYQRVQLLIQLRNACHRGTLRVEKNLVCIKTIYNAVKRTALRNGPEHVAAVISGEDGKCVMTYQQQRLQSTECSDRMLLAEVLEASPSLPVTARCPEHTMTLLRHIVHAEHSCNTDISAQPVFARSSRMSLRHPGYSAWQWPHLMYK